MKKISSAKLRQIETDDMRKEYRFDYRKAQSNRFAGRLDKSCLVVSLDPDVSKMFTNPESVNAILRALITAMPKAMKSKIASKSSSRLTKHNGRKSY
ncbi:MAG: hypothetical protein EHM45_13885 [Desulfobacteraceae bacterium]|nr:MAG: hypothetical protein EHM45_13885 [Desulfobacteraceae bacterium]